MDLKTKFKKLLRQHGLSQNEIAAELNMSRQNFYNKMAANSFTNEQLETLAKRFDVPVSYFTDANDIPYVMEPEAGYSEIIKLKKEKEYLEMIIGEMKGRIKSLEEFLDYLKSQKKSE